MTVVNEANIDLTFRGFKSIYTTAFMAAKVFHPDLAMTVASSGRDEHYGWLGQFPRLREWLAGEREVKQLEAFGFTIANRKFESTVGVKRDDFADDRLGVFKPMFAEMGQLARQHPDELIFELLASGFTSLCYDGEPFFAPEHPSVDRAGAAALVSNMQTGTDPAWFLLDTSRSLRPLIWQEREAYDFAMINNTRDAQVFMTDEFIYGVRARVSAGFGLWQLGFGSKAALTSANYAAARSAMMSVRGDKGRLLGVAPDTLIVPPALEEAGRKLLNSEHGEGGASNPWKDTAKLIVSPYLES